jgi:hypothetical protein
MVQLSATSFSCIAILCVSLVSFVAITLCVASQQVFMIIIIIIIIYLFIDSVRKILGTPSYTYVPFLQVSFHYFIFFKSLLLLHLLRPADCSLPRDITTV